MKRLPLGIQNFKKIIEGNYIYADKTKYIYDLVNNASYYFLSRPRRFGKSLLLDTIAEVFKGEKEIFNGLWIYDSDYSFEPHPVIRIDMSRISSETPDNLKESLLSYLNLCYTEEELTLNDNIASDAFANLIYLLNKKYGQGVVVLVDEYDKPILDHITDISIAEKNRLVLREFYGVLKSLDSHLRFTFITGVTKFAKTSVFSELNNLLDITLTDRYANICGITIGDLDGFFSEHIESISKLEIFNDYDNVKERILAWYDGYSWNGIDKVINPFSLISFFKQERFGAFWYASGSPNFLIDLIKENPDDFSNIGSYEMSEFMLDASDFNRLEAVPLLFQSGYLTIKGIEFDGDLPIYLLEVPNLEVNEAFNKNIIAAFTNSGYTNVETSRREIGKALRNGNLQIVLEMLRRLFASIPYNLHVSLEAYYHSIFFAVMNVLGFKVESEVSGSKGRIDALLDLGDVAYIFEFKYENCPNDASVEIKEELYRKALSEGMAQINDKGYSERFIGSEKTVYKAVFAFLGRGEIEMSVF
ncbi:MAG: ATP-binding protein [Candidatus Cloacimonetes bacterium]|nr:ATP-binding protein [Candidatus Cloacimonadota bacterium]